MWTLAACPTPFTLLMYVGGGVRRPGRPSTNVYIQYHRAGNYLLMYVLHAYLMSIMFHFRVLFYPTQYTVLHTCGHWRPVRRPLHCSCI